MYELVMFWVMLGDVFAILVMFFAILVMFLVILMIFLYVLWVGNRPADKWVSLQWEQPVPQVGKGCPTYGNDLSRQAEKRLNRWTFFAFAQQYVTVEHWPLNIEHWTFFAYAQQYVTIEHFSPTLNSTWPLNIFRLCSTVREHWAALCDLNETNMDNVNNFAHELE